MKTIQFPAEKSEFFKDLLKSSVTQNDEKGFSIEEVRAAIKVLDKIDAADASVELEDAHYLMVKDRVDNMRWRIATADIVEFVDCVGEAL